MREYESSDIDEEQCVERFLSVSAFRIKIFEEDSSWFSPSVGCAVIAGDSIAGSGFLTHAIDVGQNDDGREKDSVVL